MLHILDIICGRVRFRTRWDLLAPETLICPDQCATDFRDVRDLSHIGGDSTVPENRPTGLAAMQLAGPIAPTETLNAIGPRTRSLAIADAAMRQRPRSACDRSCGCLRQRCESARSQFTQALSIRTPVAPPPPPFSDVPLPPSTLHPQVIRSGHLPPFRRIRLSRFLTLRCRSINR